MSVLKLRPSKADIAWHCPESLRTVPGRSREPAGPEADMGSAVHSYLEHLPDGLEILKLADRFNVDATELRWLCHEGKRIYETYLHGLFRGGRREKRLEHVAPLDHEEFSALDIRGMIDEYAIEGDLASLNDWKTGRVAGGYEHQQRCYAMLLLQHHPELTQVRSHLTFIRLGFIDRKTYTRQELDDWLTTFQRRIENGMGTFLPGDHCQFCPRVNTCPGARQHLAESIAIMSTEREIEVTKENAAIVGPILADHLRKARFIIGRCEKFIESLRYQVDRVGPIPAGEDQVLRIQEQPRSEIIPALAGPILKEWLSEDQILAAMKLSKNKLERGVKENAQRGEKGAAVEMFLDELTAANAIGASTVKTLIIARPVTEGEPT